jgi:hypothetical protein
MPWLCGASNPRNKVLERGLETSYDGPSIEQARTFSCQATSACTAN